jgi:solute carrier family 40 (iron-regulated transporter), member 1
MGLFLGQKTPETKGAPPAGYLSDYRDLVVSLIVLCSIIERMCAVGNSFVMERDWVPTIATDVTRPPLHILNATMNRIDLASKILAPVIVSVIAIRASSAILAGAIALLNLSTVTVEYYTARRAWDRCQCLKMERADMKASINGDEEILVVEPPAESRGLQLYFGTDICLRK